MIAPYVLRLFCLCLAAFFAIHSVAGLAVAAGGQAAVRAAGRMRPRMAVRFLLALRLLPAALALSVVAGLCIPSYLWLEPETNTEELGAACLSMALLTATLWSVSIVRGLRSVVLSARHTRRCERLGVPSLLPGSRLPVWIVDVPSPVLAVVGVLGSRTVMSRPVGLALSAEELDAALRHEESHRVSRDNLKRLLLLLAPGMLPGFHGFEAMERGWARFTEWAADDDAVAGDAHRAISLAAALVRVARMESSLSGSPLAISFLGDRAGISARVDRLLGPVAAAPIRRRASAGVAGGWLLGATCVAFMWHPATLASAHRLLEQLIH